MKIDRALTGKYKEGIQKTGDKMRPVVAKSFYMGMLLFSMLCLCCALRMDRMGLLLPAFPAYVFLMTLNHETGHLVGCLVNGNRITGMQIFFLSVRGKVLTITYPLRIESYCSFIKKEVNTAVYLGGPFASLGFMLTMFVWAARADQRTLWALAALSLGHVMKSVIPFPYSDIRLLSQEMVERTKV